MAERERFHYSTPDDVRAALERLGHALPMSEDLSVLAQPLPIGPRTTPNRLAVHPMEAFDSAPDGSPGESTFRRYRRFGAGGSGLIWFESCAVVPEGRSGPHQLMLTPGNVTAFARLVEDCRRAAREAMGQAHEPVCILQLTHSGRYSKPRGVPEPVLACRDPGLDSDEAVPADHHLVTDEELDRLQDRFVESARLARDAGFDGVDVKACHGFLLADLLGARTRTGSRYGGEGFENRTRMLRETHARTAAEVPGLIVTTRMNACDAAPWPHGWGTDADDPDALDLREPVRLARALERQGAPCLNVTVGRLPPRPPADPADDDLLADAARLVEIARDIQRACPGLAVVGTGYTPFRHFLPTFAAGALHAGWARMVGVGRMALAYPDFARDILERGRLAPERACITCGGCGRLALAQRPVTCVVRGPGVHGPPSRSTHEP